MLLRMQRDNPEWNVSMAPYWASLPASGASLTKHTYPEDKLGLLQDKLLVRMRACRSLPACLSAACQQAAVGWVILLLHVLP